MADFAGTHVAPNKSPQFYYDVSYKQTARGNGTATYSVTVGVRMGSSGSSFGYSMTGTVTINGVAQSIAWKGNEFWYGTTTHNFTYTINVTGVSNSSGTLTAKLQVSRGGSGTAATYTSSGHTVSLSTFNTAPSAPTNLQIWGGYSVNDKLVSAVDVRTRENYNYWGCQWSASSDAENNVSYYEVMRTVNENGWVKVEDSTDLEAGDPYGTITNSIRYCVRAVDKMGEVSGWAYSPTARPNRVGSATFKSWSRSIGYVADGSYYDITVHINPATADLGSPTYKFYCDDITVYNQITNNATSRTLRVLGRGTTAPTGISYIKMEDIISKFLLSGYVGTLKFALQTESGYGTVLWSTTLVNTDIRVTPNPATLTFQANANSTTYQTLTNPSGNYYIPNGSRYNRLTWTAGSGKLGETIKYELYSSIDNGASWSKVAVIASGTLAYNHLISKPTYSYPIRYKIRTVCSYNTGYWADSGQTASYQMQVYNGVKISVGTITRGATTASAIVAVKTDSSITGFTTVGSWVLRNRGGTTNLSTGTLTTSQANQTISLTGLTETGQYDLIVTYKDGSGLSSNATKTISIQANAPIVDINKYGLGIGGNVATSDYAFYVKGNTYVNGSSTISGSLTAGSKSAITVTPSYGEVPTYCDESPNHVFTDRGRAQLDSNGYCYVFIDEIFMETVNTENLNYWIQLTGIKTNNIQLEDTQPNFFVVKGEPNKEFMWQLSAERLGTEYLRFSDAYNLFNTDQRLQR